MPTIEVFMIINVDDLGLSSAVNQAVLLLAEKNRIHATSFMSFGQISMSEVSALQRLNIDIGLHVDFTELVKEMYNFGSLKRLIQAAWLRRLPRKQVDLVIERQLDLFEEKIGCSPVFVDGHQHVHQFPVIRESLLDAVQKRYGQAVAMRSTRPRQTNIKAHIIYALGGRYFDVLCRRHHLVTNSGFSGVYDFSADSSKLQRLWKNWLTKTQLASGLIMCHPAVPDKNWSDVIKPAREQEFDWMMSDSFGEMLDAFSIKKASWKDFNR